MHPNVMGKIFSLGKREVAGRMRYTLLNRGGASGRNFPAEEGRVELIHW